MKKFFYLIPLISLLYCGVGMAAQQILLLPVDEGETEGIILDRPQFDESSREKFLGFQEEVQVRDLDVLDNQNFSPSSYINDHLTIEGQITATVMMLGGRVSVGHRFLNDHLEIGVDAGAMLVMAGTGVVSPELGTYIKARLNPEDSVTYYFKGRLYRAWGLNEDIHRTMNYGVGAEFDGGAFIELSVMHFSRAGKGDLVMPFLTFGMQFSGPKTQASESYLFAD